MCITANSVVCGYLIPPKSAPELLIHNALQGMFNIKVTGQSSIELFATKKNNKVVYVSPTVHVSNKLTRAK